MSGRGVNRRRDQKAEPDAYTVRVALRLDDALTRAQSGDALVVDLLDMDPATARRIIAADVAAVLNVAPSYSGRFPVTGPQLLVESGLILMDALGSGASVLRDGERVELVGDDVRKHDAVVVSGRRRTLTDLGQDAAAADASGGVRIRAEALLADTVALQRSPAGARPQVPPGLEDLVRGRVGVLVCGPLEARQMSTLRTLRDRVIVAAGDAGGVAATAQGLRPDAVLGGTAPASATSAAAADEPVPEPRPGRRRPRQQAPMVEAGVTEGRPLIDGAIALLFAAGARAVVVAGAEGVDDPLMGLLDRPRSDAASSGLLRLDVSGRLVSLATLEALTGVSGVSAPRASGGLLSTRRRRLAAVAAGVVGALALGVLLGAGPLAQFGPTGSARDRSERSLTAVTSANADLANENAASDALLSSSQQTLVAGRLKGHRAVLVVADGIDQTVVEGVTSVLAQAGAVVAGSVRLTPAFGAPSKQVSLDDLATRLAPTGVTIGSGEVGTRAAGALAASIVTTKAADVGTAAPQGQGLLDALTQVGVIQTMGSPWVRSDLVVELVPNAGGAAQTQALVRIASALASQATATLVTSPGAPRPASAVAQVSGAVASGQRASVSSQAAQAIGRIALVQGLAAGVDGKFGVFGPLAVVAPAPSSSPAATAPPSPSVAPTG